MEIPPVLTAREREILPFLLSGATRNQIASHFKISPETVKLHTRNTLEKFDAATVREGFARMNQYQTYYGIGGLGVTRFVTDHAMVFELYKNRTDGIMTQIDTQIVMEKALLPFQRRYFLDVGELDVELVSREMEIEHVPSSELQRKIYKFSPKLGVPNQRGSRFTLKEVAHVSNHFSRDYGKIEHTWSVPNDGMNFSFNFDPEAVPDAVECQVLVGLDEIQHPAIEVVQTAQKLSLKVKQHLGASRLIVRWRWEDS